MDREPNFVTFIESDAQPAEITLALVQEIIEQQTDLAVRYGDRDKFVKGTIFPPEEHPIGIYIDKSELRHTSIVEAVGISKDDVTDAGRLSFTRDSDNKINGVIVSGDSVGLDKPTRESASTERDDTVHKLK